MKVAIYSRVSTKDQDLTIQKEALNRYCKLQGWEIFKSYEDKASGGTADRAGLSELMADAASGKFSMVLCTKLDRFGRSLRHFTQHLHMLDEMGKRFIAIEQGIDTDKNNPCGRLLIGILASIAEFEKEQIRERTAAGIEAAKRKGIKLGRKNSIFDKSKVIQLHQDGKSLREIAKVVGVSTFTVRRCIQEADEV